MIDTLSVEDLTRVLDSIRHRFRAEARALVITLYYTGARPSEVLELRAKDINKIRGYIAISIIGKKGGLPRIIHFKYSLPLIKELYNYSQSLFSDYVLFNHFRNKYTRVVKRRKGFKENTSNSDKLRYYFKRWFSVLYEGGVNPYFLRHNRFSRLAMKGVNDRLLRTLKGSKTNKSIDFYVHLSKDASIEVAKKID